MDPFLSLDDERVRDPEVAGAKASMLASARSAGIPVLPGWVLPAGESADAMHAGAEAFRRSGSAAASLAVAGAEIGRLVRRRLVAIADAASGSLIVRSSTPFDADGRWSGAFATYHDVGPSDLLAAVRGCWASAFSRDATGRGARLGVSPSDGGVAVLLQPWIAFDAGGTATVGSNGTTAITIARGGPAGIVGGRQAGTVVEIAPDVVADAGDAERFGTDPTTLRSVAELLRRIEEATGDDTIEWGATTEGVVVLQIGRMPAGPPRRSLLRRRAPLEHPDVARRLAAAADRYPAPLGEAWVLPWALGLDPLPPTPVLAIDGLRRAIAEAREQAAALAEQAWDVPGSAAAAEAAFRAALGPDPARAWERLAALRPVDPGAAARVLGLIDAVGRHLADEEVLPHPEAVWRMSPAELERAARGVPAPVRAGADRWEPFVFDVAEHTGHAQLGRTAAPGIGAGRPIAIRGPEDLVGIAPRRVLALARPVPSVAPLLWSCAAIVAAGGSTGAHLFEVARSLGVPAVVGVDLMRAAPNTVVAVDGDDGRVTAWSPRDTRSRRTGA